MKNNIIKISLSIVVPLILSFFLIMLLSIMIIKTNIPESLESIFMISVSSVCSVMMTVMLIINSKLKPIVCSTVSFFIIFIIKILLSLFITEKVVFNLSGIINIVFIALFCFTGGLLGVNFKK